MRYRDSSKFATVLVLSIIGVPALYWAYTLVKHGIAAGAPFHFAIGVVVVFLFTLMAFVFLRAKPTGSASECMKETLLHTSDPGFSAEAGNSFHDLYG